MAGKKDKDNKAARIANKKAFYDYEIVERIEAGLSLLGTEVKSLRAGNADLKGSYGRLSDDDEVFLVGANISPYDKAGAAGHDPLRKRKLLLHKAEIRKIRSKLQQKGYTIVPLAIYFNSRGLAKVELGLARGKRKYDKRKAITERQQKKDIDRQTKKYR